MNELIDIILRLSDDIKFLKAFVQTIKKNKAELFRETWIDGQDVMQSLHISKRTLQSLRDCKVLPYSRINGKFYYKIKDIEDLLEIGYSGDSNEGRRHGAN